MKKTTSLGLLVLATSSIMIALWFTRSEHRTADASHNAKRTSTGASELISASGTPLQSAQTDDRRLGVGASSKRSTEAMSSATPTQQPASPQPLRQIGPKFENHTLNKEGGINFDAARSILELEAFDAQAEHYARQAAADPDTARLTAAYTTFMREVIARHRLRLRLKSMACGSKQCIGALSDGDLAEYERWASAMRSENALPHFTRLEFIVNGISGKPELRFIFALDPSRGIR